MGCSIRIPNMVSSTDITQRIVEAVLAQRLAPGTRLGEQSLALWGTHPPSSILMAHPSAP